VDTELQKAALATIEKLKARVAELESALATIDKARDGRRDDSVGGAIAKALAGGRGKNLLARDRDAVVKDRRPKVEHDLTDSIAKRRQELSK
jgi:hypothetical protein